jgi:hypothetical protein
MKYARYLHNGNERYGVVEGEELIELDGSVLNAHVETGLRYPVSTVREKAKQYIQCHSCFNDVTERDLVAKNPFNLTISKSFDTFSAFGPFIVTDIDPDNLQVKTYLNGELMQDDNTSECVFNAEMPHTLPRRHCDHRNTNSLRHGLENMPSAIRGLSAVAPGAGLVESDALKCCSWGFLRTATEPHTLAHQLRQKGNYHVSE